MSTNSRRGNRSTNPAKGGLRRSNTPPPPTVRLGINGLPEVEPVSTSRPRDPEPGDAIPRMQKPPADVVAAAAAANAPAPREPEATTTKIPAVVPSSPKVGAAPTSQPALSEHDRETLHSQPGEAAALAEEEDEDEDEEGQEGQGEGVSQTAPAVSAKAGGLTVGNRRKVRRSNKRGAAGNSTPPPPKAESPAAAAPAPAAAKATEAKSGQAKPHAPDEPPTSHAPASDLAEKFFDHGERAAAEAHAAHHADAGDLDDDDPRLAHKQSPEAQARRAKNWRYVQFFGGACFLLLLVAVVKNRGAHGDRDATHPSGVAVVVPAETPEPSAKAEAPVAPVEVTVAPSATAPAGSASSAAPGASSEAPVPAPGGTARFQEPVAALGEAAKGQGADPASAGAPLPPVATEPTEGDRRDAVKEKRSCQSLLDQGAFAKAVEAGERSVALDPADGEAWLMLGAAYQSMGKGAEARRSFASCVAEGKRGPIGECRAMLR